MAGFNDTLTLGLILLLLFGAASLYLYTRVQQCEQKLNLVESILLDIKMSAELQGYPEPPQKEEATPPTKPASPKTSPFLSMDEQEMYQGAIEEAMEEGSPIEAEELSSLEQAEEKTVPTALPKLNTNYESMTLAELKALAKQRGITGSSSMKRSQLLDALKPKATPADGGILSALAEQGSPIESN